MSAPIRDLTGQRFGRLVVLEKTSQRKNKKVVWKCKCDCGNITYVVGGSLVGNKTKSCGCLNKEKASIQGKKSLIDLTGQRYGKLIVLKRDVDTLDKQTRWICQCDCGNIKSIRGSHLKNKKIRSCGCLGNSIGENTIAQFLNKKNIKFFQEYSFKGCVGKANHPLRFDFYLPSYNCCIEYDGIQHFQEKGTWAGKENESLEKIQIRDNIKNKYCKDNNIKLVRIPYTDYDKIEQILNKFITGDFNDKK